MSSRKSRYSGVDAAALIRSPKTGRPAPGCQPLVDVFVHGLEKARQDNHMRSAVSGSYYGNNCHAAMNTSSVTTSARTSPSQARQCYVNTSLWFRMRAITIFQRYASSYSH